MTETELRAAIEKMAADAHGHSFANTYAQTHAVRQIARLLEAVTPEHYAEVHAALFKQP